MESKKSDKANLENKKSLFIQLGLIVALAVALAAFEWTSDEKQNSIFVMTDDKFEDILIPNTVIEEPEVLPTPEVTIIDLFEIVDNTIEISNEYDLLGDEIEEDKAIQIYKPVFQTEEDEVKDDIFIKVEDMPTFKGGDIDKFREWVQKRVSYPDEAAGNGIQGKVYVTFVVEPSGLVSNVEIIRSVNPLLDDAAKEAVAASPKWEPGMQRGRAVRVRYSIPIIFRLQ